MMRASADLQIKSKKCGRVLKRLIEEGGEDKVSKSYGIN
jgi:hypothetical protein